jgi:hypothetical protein
MQVLLNLLAGVLARIRLKEPAVANAMDNPPAGGRAAGDKATWQKRRPRTA